MTPPETAALTTEIANLRGDISGFRSDIGSVSRDLGDIKTSCAVLIARSDRTEKDLDELEQRVASLEKARWPLPSLAAVCGVAGLGMAWWQAAGR